ncbi:MAG: thiamine phosphate synthase [Myxococcales bacterium]|nr:thiamine phosphate synthase [Myxococcales bacterium]
MTRTAFSDVERLRDALRVYAISPDTWTTPAEYAAAAAAAISGGATAIQLRDKRDRPRTDLLACGAALHDACAAGGAMFVVNDDVELALELGADAVHVGPDDLAVDEVLRRVGDRMVVGGSAGTVERAVELYSAGVDYLGVGAIFDARGSKPNASAPRGLDVLRTLRAHPLLATLPLVAIGGITRDTAGACIGAGADGVASIRELFGTPDTTAAARTLRGAVDGVLRDRAESPPRE